jgi:hypothetical protein
MEETEIHYASKQSYREALAEGAGCRRDGFCVAGGAVRDRLRDAASGIDQTRNRDGTWAIGEQEKYPKLGLQKEIMQGFVLLHWTSVITQVPFPSQVCGHVTHRSSGTGKER